MAKKKRSLKQLWVSERLFHNAGLLKSTLTKFRNLSKRKSILPIEQKFIEDICAQIERLKMSDRKVQSWNMYKGRSEKDAN